MDVLSDILKTIRLDAVVYFRKEFSQNWGMKIDESKYAQFHLVVSGNCWLGYKKNKKPLQLSSGDIILFINGTPHFLADKLEPKKIVPGIKILEAHKNHKKIFKNKNITTELLCGHFSFDRNINHPFLNELPEMILISNKERHQPSWLEMITNVLIQETDSQLPGSSVVSERLAEALLIHIIRSYIEQQKNKNGFLFALNDKQINSALKLLHDKPEYSWTIENIARQIGMSRASFAAKFKEKVGTPPMEYLTSWRMQKAGILLRETFEPLSIISEKVGYGSESSFNKAFKRYYKNNPGSFRRESAN